MNPAVTVAACVVLLIPAVFLLLFRKLTSPKRMLDFNPEWLSRFSLAKYRPIERLLSEEDYQFLAAQKGYDPKIVRRLRSERRKIFREYLHCLKRDFDRLEAAARLLMISSSSNRPHLAKTLLRQRLLFTYGVLAAECRLVLHGLGLGTVDITGLVGSVDAMRAQLGQLAAVREASVV